MAQSSCNKCSVCNEENGSLYCHDCEQFLCQICKSFHDKFPANKEHTVIDADKEGRRVFKPKPICKHHRKDYMYYCTDCESLICSDCITSIHSRHGCIDYMRKVDQGRQNVIETCETIKAKLKFLQDSLDAIDNITLPQIKSDRDDFDKQVGAVANELGNAFDVVKNIYKTTAADFQSSETEKMMNVRANLACLQNKYKYALVRLETVLLEPHGVTFLLEQNAIRTETENIDEIPDIPAATRINFNQDDFTDKIIDELQKRFTIWPNIFLQMNHCKVNFEEELLWFLDYIKNKLIESKKNPIIYVKSINVCSQMYLWLSTELGKKFYHGEEMSFNRLVEMFHANTDNESKQRIVDNFVSPTGNIRTLIATVAFGMGIDIPNVDLVIHWGIPSTSLSYWQEIGRCARDGRSGVALCYAFKRSVTKCNDEEFKKTADPTSVECIRMSVLSQFMLEGIDTNEIKKLEWTTCDKYCEDKCCCQMCACCSRCRDRCKCESKQKDFLKAFIY